MKTIKKLKDKIDEEDSKNRAACLIVVDKFRKKFLSVYKTPDNYAIPGGKCKVDESYEDAAIRELKEETGLVVDKRNMKKILEGKDEQMNVITYLSFIYKGHIHTEEKHYISWVPLKHLNTNKNPRWKLYNSAVYDEILKLLY
jgi:ADP-ribose pyrophosphatase YjhB (NUDIX family)